MGEEIGAGTGARVLIVDDHPGFRAVARRMLEAEGFTVVGEAADGQTAVRRTVALRPNLVLLDVCLPDLDGFEVCIRLQAATCPPAVVLTSSRDAGQYRHQIATSGAHGFLPKAQLTGPAFAELVEGL